MRLKQGLIACILLLGTSSISIPPSFFRHSQPGVLPGDFDDDPHIGQLLNITPEVIQLISIFENITLKTDSELASMFFSTNSALAVLSFKFWAHLLKSLFLKRNGFLGLLHEAHNIAADPLLLNDLIFDIAKDASTDAGTNEENPSLVSWPRESAGYKVVLQSDSSIDPEEAKAYGPEMSYETLQKWIEDYGLSASSLRDYLETYLFAGDHSWAAEITASGDHDGTEPDLKTRLAILGANIRRTLVTLPDTEENTENTEQENGDSVTFQIQQAETAATQPADHVPFTFQGYDNHENSKAFTLNKRSLDEDPDYNSLVYSFSRLDGESEDLEEDMVEGIDEIEDAELQSKHRIFENNEIVSPLSAVSIQESPRSKDYREIIYEDELAEDSLAKREEDCVPVTWYNVFHHSVFGKHKFCHV